MARLQETELYAPVKAYLESQGYEVKAEVKGCDIVAVRGEEPPVIVELKRDFSLPLLLQGVDRLRVTDSVYLAVTDRARAAIRRRQRGVVRLCRRLGLGLIAVDPGEGRRPATVEVLLDPGPYQPRKQKRRAGMLLKEFAHRVGDPNQGGATRTPIMTAYRQRALLVASALGARSSASPRDLRDETGVEKAAGILQKDVYGWFMRVERGVYALSPKGEDAIRTYADVIEGLHAYRPAAE